MYHGLKSQINFEISGGDNLQQSVREDRHLETLALLRKLNQPSATTEDILCAT